MCQVRFNLKQFQCFLNYRDTDPAPPEAGGAWRTADKKQTSVTGLPSVEYARLAR